jgi:hypothetical protein
MTPYLLALLVSLPSFQAHDWLIVPGERVGPVTVETTEAELVRLLGSDNVKPTEVHVGEDFFEPGAVLYPEDSTRRLHVIWSDTANRARPKRVYARADSSRWHLQSGITFGTTLSELERRNGKPFVLAGFEWDYSGTVTSWEDGDLGQLDGPVMRVLLRLDPPWEGHPDSVYYAVSGDRDFSSDHWAMRQLDPAVYEILVIFQ